MAGIKNLVRFAAKFLNMAKSKAKDKKKPTAKKSAKPVAKSKSKPVAKKSAKPVKKVVAKAKKVAKPVKKAKPVAKKKVVVKAKAKPVVKKKKVVAKPKAVKKAAPVKPVAKKVVAPVKVKPTVTVQVKATKPGKANKKALPQLRKDVPQPIKKQLYIAEAKPKLKELPKKYKAPKDMNLRYSDEELKEFKDLIDKKLVTAREELKYLKESLDNHNDNQAGSKAWNMEEGSDTTEMETLMNQISRQHQYIRNLELALVRIENKTYGICRLSGKLIPKERLRIVPHATLSLEAKMSRKSDEVSPAAASAATPPTDFAEGFED